jgi:c(7)-type cytochrome triheme protein
MRFQNGFPGKEQPMKRMLIAVLFVLLILPATARAQKVGGGDVHFTPKDISPVLFSHQKHVKDKGIKCTGCHYQIFQMSQGSYKMDMSKMTKGDFCGTCHNGERSFDIKAKEHCGRCHK